MANCTAGFPSFLESFDATALRCAAEAWVASPFLAWSLGPFLGSLIGFAIMCPLCEWIARQPWAAPYLIEYDGESRSEALEKTYKVVPWATQLWRTFLFVGGPYSIVGFGLHTVLFPLVMDPPQAPLPSLGRFVKEFFLLMIAADFYFYWTHRAAHEIPFLWEHHKYHHLIRTPTAVGTAYISIMDALPLTPMTVCALVVHPHPITYTVYIGYHLANATLNHSGLDWWPLNFVMGKTMPLRTLNAHHDAHHQYSNKGYGAKNYADVFCVWDWLFGTMEPHTANGHPKCER